MALIPLSRLVPGALHAFKPGVPVPTDFPGITTGAEVTDVVGGKVYINTGTAAAPVYVSVGSQL